jgi:cysteine desulfurase
VDAAQEPSVNRIDPPRPIYLDYAATTPVEPRVAACMLACLQFDGMFGNPSSTHAFGRAARAAIEQARAQVAALIGAPPADLVFTSGATESDNLAVLGVARGEQRRGGHVVTVRTEHKAVLDACKQLQREGHEVTYLTPDRSGMVGSEQVREALRAQTVLVSVMHVNNEIGVIQDIAAIGALCRAHGAAFHVDAAQSAGRLPIDVQAMQVDLLSLTAHKLYGPKGIGALYVHPRCRARLLPLQFGGGQERGLRSGTLPAQQIVGFGAACQIALEEGAAEADRQRVLREQLWSALSVLPDIRRNSEATGSISSILNVAFPGVEGESLLFGLPELALTTGSACNSESDEPSYVLRALGLDAATAQSSLRFSLGRYTSAADIERAAAAVCREVRRLRAISP